MAVGSIHVSWVDSIYEASSDFLRALAIDQFNECDSIMLIGHNPGLDMLLLETDPTATRFIQNNKLMTTAIFGSVEIDIAEADDSRLRARLLNLHDPKIFKPLPDFKTVQRASLSSILQKTNGIRHCECAERA